MSRDLLDRLVADIFEVTEALMKMESTDLLAWQPGPASSVEKQYGSQGHDWQNKFKAKRAMTDGIHRSVC